MTAVGRASRSLNTVTPFPERVCCENIHMVILQTQDACFLGSKRRTHSFLTRREISLMRPLTGTDFGHQARFAALLPPLVASEE
jgi:hypothetical protein